MPDLDSDRPLERTANRAVVLTALMTSGTTTRVSLADHTGLSRPTVNSIVSELADEGLVEEVGSAAGQAGRAAVLYRLASDARTVIGIDLGGSKTLAAVADLSGTVRALRSVPTQPDLPGIVDRLADLCRRLMQEAGLSPDSLTAVSLGTPGVPHPVTQRMQYAANIPELAHLDLRHDLSAALGLPVALDNDVNMAILGERWKGTAQRAEDAVFIAIGTGLGMGIVAGGRLQRGHSGAAGEVGFLPLVGDPFDGTPSQFGPIEELVTSHGIRTLYESIRHAHGEGPLEDVPAIFEAARRGSPAAMRAIDEPARQLALVISAVHAVLDPERVVLGGGIGSNPLMLTLLRRHLDRLSRKPPLVEASALDGRAAVYGALAVSLSSAQRSVGIEPDFITV
jgi:predicted NBD/HSP70 family sugar kinase